MNNAGNSSSILSCLVLGTAGLGGVWGRVDPVDSVNAILRALENGISSIDTAPAYGDGERLVGKALQQWQGPPPLVSTKVGRLKSHASDKGIYDYTTAGMVRSIESSLTILGLSSVDILFLHEPGAIPEANVAGAVEQMIKFKKNGFTKRIGLGGNYPSIFAPYVKEGVFDVVMEYNRLNACCVDALHTSLPECRNNGVEYWAASPLHMGLLGRRFADFVKSKPGWLDQRFINNALEVNKIAKENGVLLSTLALRFLQNITSPVRIVIGPVNQNELADCMRAIVQGPLEYELYNRILNLLKDQLNTNSNASDR